MPRTRRVPFVLESNTTNRPSEYAITQSPSRPGRAQHRLGHIRSKGQSEIFARHSVDANNGLIVSHWVICEGLLVELAMLMVALLTRPETSTVCGTPLKELGAPRRAMRKTPARPSTTSSRGSGMPTSERLQGHTHHAVSTASGDPPVSSTARLHRPDAYRPSNGDLVGLLGPVRWQRSLEKHVRL